MELIDCRVGTRVKVARIRHTYAGRVGIIKGFGAYNSGENYIIVSFGGSSTNVNPRDLALAGDKDAIMKEPEFKVGTRIRVKPGRCGGSIRIGLA